MKHSHLLTANYVKLAIILSIIGTCVNATDLLITQPGIYKLGDNLTFNPSGSDNAINITVSNVVLDLGNKTVSQGNAVANVDGITINSGLTDILIQNGFIQNFTGNGILLNQSCTRIKINNLQIINCSNCGILLSGTVGNTITNTAITQCSILGCSNVSAFGAINITQANGLKIENIVVANTVGTTNISFITLANCVLCSFNNIYIKNNSSTGFMRGVNESAGTINKYSNILIANNTSANQFLGINIINSNADSFNNVRVLANSSSTQDLIGFNLNNCDNGMFRSCLVQNNSGILGFTGFNFFTTGNQNFVIDCLVTSNSISGAAANAIGFNFDDGSREVLRKCQVLNNSSTNGTATGIFFQGTGGSGSIITNCLVSRNVGVNAASSFGVNRLAGANNLFPQVVSFNNNTTAANQLSGVPAGSVQTPAAPASNNINSLSSPWSSLALGS